MEGRVFERVLELSRRMAETRHLDPLLEYAIWEAVNLVGAECGALVLLNDSGELDFRVQRDREGHFIHNEADAISVAILKQVIASGQPLVIEDASTDPAYPPPGNGTATALRSVLCVPLTSRGRAIGALFVENRSVSGQFDAEHLVPLTFFANQAAVSIENAILNDDLEQRVTSRTKELEQALSQLEHTWQETVETNRLQTTFLGNVAHDIRAPLSLAVTALSMMHDGIFGDLTEAQDEWVGRSLKALDHALELIQDMFDLARIEMGQFKLELEQTDLAEFLHEIYLVGEGLPWPLNVEFQLDLPLRLPHLKLDRTRMRQVLLNLLTNALKFTDAGSVTLYARPVERPCGVLVGVRDTGVGIEADDLDAVFDRFRQVGSEDRRRLGTGLGLAISREMVELHDGRIWVESMPGAGADFKIILPQDGGDGCD